MYREHAEARVLNCLQGHGPFISRNKLASLSQLNGRPLDRVIKLMRDLSEVAVFRISEPGGDTHGMIIYGSIPECFEHRLTYDLSEDGVYDLSEASSDKVMSIAAGIDARHATKLTIESAQSGGFTGVFGALLAFLGVNVAPTQQASTSGVTPMQQCLFAASEFDTRGIPALPYSER